MALGIADFDQVRRVVRERSGIVLAERDAQEIETRLLPVAKANGSPTPEAFIARLRTLPALAAQLVEAVAAHSGGFTVDSPASDMLSGTILPALIMRRQSCRRLRIWCPACGGGQEPYSLALLIRERFPELSSWDVVIHASDPSAAQIAKANAGRYSGVEVLSGLPTPVLLKHFANVGGAWEIKDSARTLVRFNAATLIADWPPLEQMDIIFIRNVLVYFGLRTKRAVMERVRSALTPDGYLFGGSADARELLDERFERMQDEQSGFYQSV
ncbi:MAG: protein-glutamate O-methyltransferase CheR [Planctomycetes bacterium]|nr:protein-glutamate O-methyltransferase CheR [Planctomycetota bacterium]